MASRETAIHAVTDGAPDIVDMSGVSFTWPGGQNFGLSVNRFQLAAGSRTLLIGPSGTGKSTLLSLLAGIVSPATGQIQILGNDIAALSSAARDRFRAEHIGVMFQMFNLLPYGTVIDNVLLPLSFAPERRARAQLSGQGDERAAAAQILRALGLEDAVHKGPAAALSVGQQQRVAAARALIGAPELIIADEPTSALDRQHQTRFLELLFGQMAAAGTSLIMVSHDESLGSQFDRVIALEDVVQSSGPVTETPA